MFKKYSIVQIIKTIINFIVNLPHHWNSFIIRNQINPFFCISGYKPTDSNGISRDYECSLNLYALQLLLVEQEFNKFWSRYSKFYLLHINPNYYSKRYEIAHTKASISDYQNSISQSNIILNNRNKLNNYFTYLAINKKLFFCKIRRS